MKLPTDTLRKNNPYVFFTRSDMSYLHSTGLLVNLTLQVDELLKNRDTVHSSFTVCRPANHNDTGLGNGKVDDSKAYTSGEDGGSDGKEKPTKKKWFNLNLRSDKKLG